MLGGNTLHCGRDFATVPEAMRRGPLQDGERVVLVDEKGRRFLKRLRRGHRMAIRGTVLCADDLIGRDEGVWVGHGEAECFLALRPTYADSVTLAARPVEPVFPKDAGAVLARGDLRPGDTVIEVGAGCGALTVALLRMITPGGRLFTYELREEFAEHARAAVEEQCGTSEGWTLRLADARRGFQEREVDHVIADMPDPSALVEPAARALRPGGGLLFYVPTVPQFVEAVERLRADARFALVQTFELLERGWHVQPPSVRPDHRMVAHTGFLTCARRTCAGLAPG